MTTKDDSDSAWIVAAGCGIALFCILCGIAISALFGYLLMVVLAAVHIKLNFWICWAIWLLAGSTFGASKR